MPHSPASTLRTLTGAGAILLMLTVAVVPLDGVRAQTPPGATASAPASAALAPPAVAAPLLTPARDLPLVKPPVDAYADNPYGLRALWGQGDIVARLTLLILLVMSVASWYVLVRKLIEQRRLRLQASAAHTAFGGLDDLRQGADGLAAQSPFRFIVESSMDAASQHASVAEDVDLNTWLTQNIERSVATVQSRTQDGLAVLATVGATAPFVGLFGTVWGIYNALVKIGASGQASIDKVAGPVGEALIMTAIGLAVAVPAVLSYNWLVRRNRLAMEEVRSFGSDLHTRVLSAVGRSRRTSNADSRGA